MNKYYALKGTKNIEGLKKDSNPTRHQFFFSRAASWPAELFQLFCIHLQYKDLIWQVVRGSFLLDHSCMPLQDGCGKWNITHLALKYALPRMLVTIHPKQQCITGLCPLQVVSLGCTLRQSIAVSGRLSTWWKMPEVCWGCPWPTWYTGIFHVSGPLAERSTDIWCSRGKGSIPYPMNVHKEKKKQCYADVIWME